MSSEPTEVIMPLMGEGITEATLVKWLKNPGEAVEKDEPLLEISTDKVDTEIPAPASGYLVKTYATAGENVLVNATIAFIAEDKAAKVPDTVAQPEAETRPAASAGASAAATPSPSAPPPRFEATAQQGAVRSSPLVRKMARELNLNLAAVAGRGVAGRITKADVLNFIEKIAAETGMGGAPTHEELAQQQTVTKDGKEYLDGVEVRREAMSKMRRLTAEHMVKSVSVSPHVTTTFEIDMHRLVDLRNKHKETFKAKEGFGLTFTHLITHAVVQTIKKHPLVNSSVDGFDILHKDDINIGLAVAIESGLIVPVLRKMNDCSLTELARAANDLVFRARNKKLNPEDVQGGTFSVTNPGLFGSVHSNPIINQPQVAILNVGAVVKKPVVVNEDIVIRPMMHAGLTFDHRVIDGEGGAKFLRDLKEIIETYPDTL